MILKKKKKQNNKKKKKIYRKCFLIKENCWITRCLNTACLLYSMFSKHTQSNTQTHPHAKFDDDDDDDMRTHID